MFCVESDGFLTLSFIFVSHTLKHAHEVKFNWTLAMLKQYTKMTAQTQLILTLCC